MIWDKLSKQTVKEIQKMKHIDLLKFRDIIKYKHDRYDEWQSADKTWKLKTGDCEDFSLFMMAFFNRYFNLKYDLILSYKSIWNDHEWEEEFIGHAAIKMFDKICDYTKGQSFWSEKYYEEKTGFKIKYRIPYNMVIFWYLWKKIESFFRKVIYKLNQENKK